MTDDDEPKLDLSAWEQEEPSADFAERVTARIMQDAKADTSRAATREPTRARARARWIAGATVFIAAAAAVAVFASRPATHGEITVDARREISMGSRVTAVLEPGAHVKWDGDDVTQEDGEVFYRVERGAPLVVHTQAGDATVLGTCFSVKVRKASMTGRDAKVGGLGGVLSALAVVGVFEGRVAVSHASESVVLGPGESAKLNDRGVTRTGSIADGDHAFHKADDDEPLATANQNLVESVRDYKDRLHALEGEKDALQKKLTVAEEKLAHTGPDGSAPPKKSEFDLSTDDWTELAKTGTIKYEVPCFTKTRTGMRDISSFQLDKLGLPDSDFPQIQAAYTKSRDRMWGTIVPLCAQAVGSADVAEKLGPNSCIHVVLDIARANDVKGTNDALYAVGEIRAGLRPMPGPNDNVPPVEKMFLALTAESGKFEADLAQSFGPDEAHRLAYGRDDGMCIGTSIFGGPGPREPKQ
jgi:ferric-dicitrate binding protein FerR (iron transport regulator)